MQTILYRQKIVWLCSTTKFLKELWNRSEKQLEVVEPHRLQMSPREEKKNKKSDEMQKNRK